MATRASSRISLGSDLLGLKMVAISDSKGGIYNEDGIDFTKAVAWKERTGSVINFPGRGQYHQR